jgi:hypothetical protein
MSILQQGHLSLASCPPLPEEGPLNAEVTFSDPEALRLLRVEEKKKSKFL